MKNKSREKRADRCVKDLRNMAREMRAQKVIARAAELRIAILEADMSDVRQDLYKIVNS